METITLPISKKVVSVKKLLSRPRVLEARDKMQDIIDAFELTKTKDPEAIVQASKTLLVKTREQDEIVADVLLAFTTLTQEDLNNEDIPYSDFGYAYGELYNISVNIPKN